MNKKMPIPHVHIRTAQEVVRIVKENNGDFNSLNGLLVAAELLPWRATDRRPGATFLRVLGRAGEVDPETERILLDNGIYDEPFSEKATNCLPGQGFQFAESEISSRKDLRTCCRVFTCDPLTARDLDDALHVKRLPDGNLEVGVHIADVSFFVPPGSDLDKEAFARATSVYLVQKVIPMLPRRLCEDLCSLNPAKDRAAFSVIWNMSPEGEILSEWFGRTMIRSCAQLNYGLVQAVIEGKANGEDGSWAGVPPQFVSSPTFPEPPHTVADLCADIRTLQELALKLRQERFRNGTVGLSEKELSITLGPTGLPTDAVPYEIRDSNKLVEDMMLLANRRVAMRLVKEYPQFSLLRRHPAPEVGKLAKLRQALAQQGYTDLSFETPRDMSESMRRVEETSQHPYIKSIVSFLAARSMSLASYFSTGQFPESDWHHFALGFSHYTHFTSPIRRYADLLVHRLLAATLEDSAASSQVDPSQPAATATEAGTGTSTGVGVGNSSGSRQIDPRRVLGVAAGADASEALQRACEHCNECNKNAANADTASAKLFLGILVRGRAVPADGVIMGIEKKRLWVYVPKFAFDQGLYFEDLNLVGFRVDKKGVVLKWPRDPHAPTEATKDPSSQAVKQLRKWLCVDKFISAEFEKSAGILPVSLLLQRNVVTRHCGTDLSILYRAVESSSEFQMSQDKLSVMKKKKKREEEEEETSEQPEAPHVVQQLKVFQVIRITVDIRPNHFPLELCLKIVHPSLP
jgi:DIS3-like exonuclease 2